MPRQDALTRFQLRRREIVNACLKLKRDVDSYNENNSDGNSIPLILDFTLDVEESSLARIAKLKGE